jgi:N-methylhydantoinase B
VSPGLFGGRPGASNRHRVLRGTDVAGLLAGGRLTLATGTAGPRLDASELGGEVEEPEAKTDEFEVRPGDVLEYGWAGGGGYGDPLLREPGRVLADVRSGIVTPERAEEAYGVVLAAGGVDEASTRERRAELRRERLRRCEPPPREPGGRAGERVAQPERRAPARV